MDDTGVITTKFIETLDDGNIESFITEMTTNKRGQTLFNMNRNEG